MLLIVQFYFQALNLCKINSIYNETNIYRGRLQALENAFHKGPYFSKETVCLGVATGIFFDACRTCSFNAFIVLPYQFPKLNHTLHAHHANVRNVENLNFALSMVCIAKKELIKHLITAVAHNLSV